MIPIGIRWIRPYGLGDADYQFGIRIPRTPERVWAATFASALDLYSNLGNLRYVGSSDGRGAVLEVLHASYTEDKAQR